MKFEFEYNEFKEKTIVPDSIECFLNIKKYSNSGLPIFKFVFNMIQRATYRLGCGFDIDKFKLKIDYNLICRYVCSLAKINNDFRV